MKARLLERCLRRRGGGPLFGTSDCGARSRYPAHAAARTSSPYVKRQKNDAADAEAICEAVTRPTMRFVALKSFDGSFDINSGQTFSTIVPISSETFSRTGVSGASS